MSRRAAAALGAALSIVAVASCGDVPTSANGVAYISAIILPSPAVERGGTLRDSLGNRAPLRVDAFDRNGNPVPNAPVTFVVAPLDRGVQIDSSGYLTVSDSERVVSFVARVGNALQTPVTTLPVVPVPTMLSRKTPAQTADTALVLPAIQADSVVVVGTHRNGTTGPVQGVIVHFAVDSLYPATVPPGSAVLIADNGRHLRDSTVAVDTTDGSGIASRSVVVLAGSGVTRVVVRATATDFQGRPLSGSPARFVLPVKP